MPKWKRMRTAAQNFFLERDIAANAGCTHSRLHRFAHFWLLVGKSFQRNRCPVRAASLAYTTLLALVPLLAVGVSITTSMLQKKGEEPIQQLIGKMVEYVAPALDLETRPAQADGLPMDEEEAADLGIIELAAGATNSVASTNAPATMKGRDRIVKQITAFIGRIKSGTLGVTGMLALLFVAISLLRTIEATFNDIWGITAGRGWFKSIVYYWTTITLGPLFLVGAITLTTGPHLQGTKAWLDAVPLLGSVFVYVLPFVILSLGFGALYALIPNTKVQFSAALVGGIVGGSLWQLNNMFSVIYVSRVVSYTNVYGGLAVFPLFLVGMYFSWLIMLLGAQVAYAWQNRAAYIEEKQVEGVGQRGREFAALRLMTHIARNFLAGGPPLSVAGLAQELALPGQLAQKVLAALVEHGLLVAVQDGELRFSPARPLDRISAYDVVCALRAGPGSEPAMNDDEARQLVRSQFERMILAEREAGAAVSLQSLAELTAKPIGEAPRSPLLGA